MPGIEISLNFVRNPRKISPFGKKSFLSKTYKAYLASWQQKNLTKWLKAVFLAKVWYQRVKLAILKNKISLNFQIDHVETL